MEHKIKSFSKINVHLNVIKKLKSNFHRIETLVMFSDLYDLLYVKKINAKKHKITFYGKFSKNISSTNTISKLLDLLDKKKLLKYIMNPSFILTWIIGIVLVIKIEPALWLNIKIICILLMSAFHMYCAKVRKLFENNKNSNSEKFYRYINEVPTVLFILIIQNK